MALVLTKYLATRVTLYKSAYNNKEKDAIASIMSRGGGAAVVAALPLTYGIPGTGAFIDIVFSVIFITVFMNSLMISAVNRTRYSEEKKND